MDSKFVEINEEFTSKLYSKLEEIQEEFEEMEEKNENLKQKIDFLIAWVSGFMGVKFGLSIYDILTKK